VTEMIRRERMLLIQRWRKSAKGQIATTGSILDTSD
jgi:hypothetical protein